MLLQSDSDCLFMPLVRLMTSISKGKNTPIVLKD